MNAIVRMNRTSADAAQAGVLVDELCRLGFTGGWLQNAA
jgi:hypothetical protein